MTPAFQNKLQSLATTFAKEVIAAFEEQTLSEIIGSGAAAKPAAKRAAASRRSNDQIDEMVQLIADAVATAEEGMNNEEIQKALSVEKKELTRPLALALKKRVIRKEGEKRSTRYFAPKAKTAAAPTSGGGAAKPKKRGATVVYADGVKPPEGGPKAAEA